MEERVWSRIEDFRPSGPSRDTLLDLLEPGNLDKNPRPPTRRTLLLPGRKPLGDRPPALFPYYRRYPEGRSLASSILLPDGTSSGPSQVDDTAPPPWIRRSLDPGGEVQELPEILPTRDHRRSHLSPGPYPPQ